MKLIEESPNSWLFAWHGTSSRRARDELRNLEEILLNVQLHSGFIDRMLWICCLSGFLAKEAYNFLVGPYQCLDNISCKLIWMRLAPASVNVFAWCFFLDTFPTKVNLISRSINIPLTCVFYGDDWEDVNQTFLHCKRIFPLWMRICRWWGYQMVFLESTDHLLQLAFGPEAQHIWDCWSLTILTLLWSF